jgi:hypothetical protein
VVRTTSRNRLLLFAAAASVALAPALAVTVQADAAPSASTARVAVKASSHAYSAGRYIVSFADDPAASYTGYAKGYPATRPTRGHKLNADSSASTKWRAHLTAKHDAALAKVGAEKIYDFTVTNNAVTANLSAAQATKLSKLSGVIALSKDKLSHPDTTSSPHFLGLDAGGGIWSQLGGAAHAGAVLLLLRDLPRRGGERDGEDEDGDHDRDRRRAAGEPCTERHGACRGADALEVDQRAVGPVAVRRRDDGDVAVDRPDERVRPAQAGLAGDRAHSPSRAPRQLVPRIHVRGELAVEHDHRLSGPQRDVRGRDGKSVAGRRHQRDGVGVGVDDAAEEGAQRLGPGEPVVRRDLPRRRLRLHRGDARRGHRPELRRHARAVQVGDVVGDVEQRALRGDGRGRRSAHGTSRCGRVFINASISSISRGARLMRSSPFSVMR